MVQDDNIRGRDIHRRLTILLTAGLLWLVLVLALYQLTAASVLATPAADLNGDVPSSQPSYGVNFISWARPEPVSEARYENARQTGAVWNRWPMYWNDIEQSQGTFSWAYQDITVDSDIQQGFQINAVLLGTPPFYTTSLAKTGQVRLANKLLSLDAVQTATPQGLYESVFDDGSDSPGPGKSINENNRWARFVYTAVNRYKPGGLQAGVNGWAPGQGITHWEIWNEPDLIAFWDGTTTDYARLLKVGYLAAKQADANAQIIFGGLANSSSNLDFYNDVMAIYDADATAVTFDYYHDIFATHNYLYAWESWLHVWRAGNTLAARGLEKPIWLNESGVPVWDDYPGPICEPDSPLRASMSEQADFIIQSAFYATYGGADHISFFQLYDDCGNQPGGTNHNYYAPEACTGDPTQDPGGDAFGLFSNPNDLAQTGCFWDHPNPEQPRPGFHAFKVLTTYFTDVEPLWRMRPGGADPFNGPQEWIAFYQPATQSRILGMWARFGSEETAVVTTTNQSGTGLLISPGGITQTVTATNGIFTITLPAATNQNAIWDPTLYPIGGQPAILIEQDTISPTVSATAPATATVQINVSWSGEDMGGGMQDYDVLVSIDQAAPTLWLTGITDVTATYFSEPGHTYQFTVIGRDKAGNFSEATTSPIITKDLTEKVYVPFVNR